MDKRTLYAVIISTFIIIVGFSIQNRVSSNRSAEESPAADAPQQSDVTSSNEAVDTAQIVDRPIAPFENELPARCVPRFNNGTVDVSFSTIDAGISSFRLLNHLQNEIPAELVLKNNSVQNPFTIIIGDRGGYALRGRYDCEHGGDYIKFVGRFVAPHIQEEPFTLTVTYTFAPDEYFFQQSVEFRNSVNRSIPIDAHNNASYTLFIGPQIGPPFEKLDNRSEYRRYVTLTGRNRDNIRLNRRRRTESISRNVDWAAISGKYFALISIPHSGINEIIISSENTEGVSERSQIFLSRSPIQSASQVDNYRFYFGPKQKSELVKYNNADDNMFQASDLNLNKVQNARPLIGWLENILKWMLTLLYSLVPNYGIAIILLTIIVKIALTPLTRKGQRSTERMQALAPKISAIREKYSDDKQRVNVETAQLYKAEKVNPAGGCLPLLLQMPFFLAMFGIFNNHFELRNAPFIKGWINDLSVPESILNFGDFTLPLLGWNDLRLLPILYAASQFLSGYLSKNSAQTQQQNKIIILMPLVLFFVLYNLPSGLLVYWVVTNILMIVQQLITKTRKLRQA